MQLVSAPRIPRDESPRRAACEYGPLATVRKRVGAACSCAGCALGPWTDPRVRKLLEVGRAYWERAVPLTALDAALQSAERAAVEVGRRATADTFSIFEGL